MRIVIDMQGAQTESRFRGIGRYTLAFAQAVARNRGEHEVLLALSGLFPETIEPIRAAFDGLLPQENIRVWHAVGPVKDQEPRNQTRREVAELIREAFLASLRPDVVHICSLFEGYGDDAVTSIGRLDHATPVSVTVHDLIPLLSPDQYLKPNPNFSEYYYRKLESLKCASIYLAISESSKREIVEHLAVPESSTKNTYEGVEGLFCRLDVDQAKSDELLAKIGLCHPFVLYTGGADERKNLPRLIEAWSALPVSLRNTHQLLFAGRMPEGNVAELQRIAGRCGLGKDELVFSGYVSDEELVLLYNLCKLFVFPSWHEGFGLPALEAMACGAPVIGANTTSVPEVIGLEEALFDPFDTAAIRDKLQAALGDEEFLARLRSHGREQAQSFSWDATAQRAIAAWHDSLAKTISAETESPNLIQVLAGKLGSYDDSQLAKLAGDLAQNEASGIERQLMLDISELCQHDAASGVQRVVRSYLHHLLNNPPRGFKVRPVYATRTDSYRYASAYTARLLDQAPPQTDDLPIQWQRGDIFFGLDMQHHVQLAHAGTYARLRQDGVVVKFLVHDLLPIQLAEFFKDSNAKELHEHWLAMIAAQDEAICVSKATADVYEEWIATNSIDTSPAFHTDWVHSGADLEGSKPSCGLPSNAVETLQILKSRPTFLAVSTLEPRKAQTQILDAAEHLWVTGEDINLVFVGQQGWKIDALVDRINSHPENGKHLFWLKGISDEYLDCVYQASTCLVAASINEGFGLPLIEAARHAVPIIARDIPIFREVAGQSAFYFTGETGEQLSAAMSEWLQLHRAGNAPPSNGMRWSTWQQSTEQLKTALIERHYPRRQLLVDISELVQRDVRTGIQRVVRSVLKEWLENPPEGFRVEPVYATRTEPYRYARKFVAQFMGTPTEAMNDEPIDFAPGDVFFGLDLQPQVQTEKGGFYQYLRRQGVAVKFLVHDLICIEHPEFFVPGSAEGFSAWLSVVGECDGAICVSKATADALASWMRDRTWQRHRKFSIEWNHNGVDVDSSAPTYNLPPDADKVLATLKQRPSFIMVGTLEPRKGYAQVLDAFENLWKSGADLNLVIVGKVGWMVDLLAQRLRSHPELGKRIFWLNGVSDDYLQSVYAVGACLIAASYDEGFGLPLIEAAQHELPIIARDIPVFREVAGEYAFYFNGKEPDDVADCILEWLQLYSEKRHPESKSMPWLTWRDSAEKIKGILVGGVVGQGKKV